MSDVASDAGSCATTAGSCATTVKIDNQTLMLTAALTTSALAHNIRKTAYMRTCPVLERYLETCLAVDTEDRLDRFKLIWRRLFECVDQMSKAFKDAVVNLEKCCKSLDVQKEKEAAKSKVKAEKEEASRQKIDLGARAAKLAKQKEQHEEIPFFTLPRESFDAFPVVAVAATDGSLPRDMDLDSPAVITCSLDAWVTQPVMQQVLASWGTRYKRIPTFLSENKVSATLAVKQGKEVAETFFEALCKNIQEKAVDMTTLSASWNSTSWLWGYSGVYDHVGTAPNCGALFRMVALGEVHTYVVDVKTLVAAFEALGEEVNGILGLASHVKNMKEARLAALKEKGAKIYYVHLKKDMLAFVPTGWFVMERAVGTCALIYGVRTFSAFIQEQSYPPFVLLGVVCFVYVFIIICFMSDCFCSVLFYSTVTVVYLSHVFYLFLCFIFVLRVLYILNSFIGCWVALVLY